MGKFFAIIGLFVLVVCLTTWWTQSNIDFYVSLFTAVPYHIGFFKAWLANILLTLIGGSSIWLNAILSLIRLIFF